MPQEIVILVVLVCFLGIIVAFGFWMKSLLNEKEQMIIQLQTKYEHLSAENLRLNMHNAKLNAEIEAQKEGNAR
ncbi:MAG: TMF family protein, partial [Sulfurospirillum sp.]|nr:TMF family protein [Sulfurospirillum sp.]